MATFLNEELLMLRDGAKAWVRDNWPVKAGRDARQRTPQHDNTLLFTQLAGLGWTGIVVPDSNGGSQMGYVGMGIVAEELGRHVVPSPFLVSAVGATAAVLLGGSEEQRREYLPGLLAGQLLGALAIDDSPTCGPLQAARSGAGWLLSGVKRPILFGSAADFVVVDAYIPSE